MSQVERNLSFTAARNGAIGATTSGSSRPNRTTSAGYLHPISNKVMIQMDEPGRKDPLPCTDTSGSCRRTAYNLARKIVRKVAKVKGPAKNLVRGVQTNARPNVNVNVETGDSSPPTGPSYKSPPGGWTKSQPLETVPEEVDDCLQRSCKCRNSRPPLSTRDRVEAISNRQASSGRTTKIGKARPEPSLLRRTGTSDLTKLDHYDPSLVAIVQNLTSNNKVRQRR